MRSRFLGLTLVALAAVACEQRGASSPTVPSAVTSPTNLTGSSAVVGTLSAHETGTFSYHIGDAFLQGLIPGLPAGDKASADNGDVVTVIGTGTFDVAGKSATGGGTFVHKTSGGTVVGSGTWTASGLLDFQSYGTGAPFPPTFFGGRVALTASLTPTASPSVHLPAILQIECLIGKTPSGAVEGIRLNVQDVINFNKTVEGSGATVYIKE